MKIATIVCMCATMLLCSCSKPDHSALLEEIKSADKMVFASMAITKTVKSERTAWYKVGKRIAVYSYDTYMQAYIDLSELQPEDVKFDDNAKTVRITLPAVETELAGRDMPMRKEYENIGPLRSNLDSKERAEMKELANRSLKKEIEENTAFNRQLTETAKRKARHYFKTIFEANGYTASVDFKAY